MSKKSHLLVNANITGLNTSILCVVEYDDNSFAPINLYTVSLFDEIEDTVIHDFRVFINLNNEIIKSKDSFDAFLEVEEMMERINYHNNKSSKVEISGYEIAEYINNKYNKNIDSLDVELKDLELFIKDCFYKDFIEEQGLRKNLKLNPFAEPLLNGLLEERKRILKKEKKHD